MASETTITLGKSVSSGTYLIGKIVWSSTPDNDANTSSVTAKLYVRKYNGSMTLTIPTSGKWSYSLTVNGDTVSGSVRKDVLTDWVLLATKTITVNHNTDGTKSITISGSVSAPSDTSLEGHTTSGSGTATLDTIPRETSIDAVSCSTAYLDGTLTYKYTPQNANYYNRCNISLNLNGNYIAIKTVNLGKKAAAQQTATVTLTAAELQTIYKKLPSTTTGMLRFTFRTYSDSDYSAQIGNALYKEITLTIPISVKPTASLSLVASNSNSWIASQGVYVQNHSGVTATLSGSAGSGATVKSYQVSGGGYSTDTSVLKISKITSSGDITITGKITDTRGRYVEVSKTIGVLPYTAPAITMLEVSRGVYSNGWTASETGKDIKITFKATLSLTAQGNTYGATFKIDSSAMTPSSGKTSGLASAASNSVYLLNLDGESSYTLTFTAKDLVGNSNSAKITIPTINVTIEFNDSGKGIAFGKTSEKDAFECAFPAEFSGGVTLIREDGQKITLDDTGWISLGLSANVAERSSSAGRAGKGCKYRVINGNHVYVAFCCEFPFSDSAVMVNLNSIPAAYRPANNMYSMCATGGRAITRCIVNSSGNVIVDWVQIISSAEQTTSATVSWVDGYIDYFI